MKMSTENETKCGYIMARSHFGMKKKSRNKKKTTTTFNSCITYDGSSVRNFCKYMHLILCRRDRIAHERLATKSEKRKKNNTQSSIFCFVWMRTLCECRGRYKRYGQVENVRNLSCCHEFMNSTINE